MTAKAFKIENEKKMFHFVIEIQCTSGQIGSAEYFPLTPFSVEAMCSRDYTGWKNSRTLSWWNKYFIYNATAFDLCSCTHHKVKWCSKTSMSVCAEKSKICFRDSHWPCRARKATIHKVRARGTKYHNEYFSKFVIRVSGSECCRQPRRVWARVKITGLMPRSRRLFLCWH